MYSYLKLIVQKDVLATNVFKDAIKFRPLVDNHIIGKIQHSSRQMQTHEGTEINDESSCVKLPYHQISLTVCQA